WLLFPHLGIKVLIAAEDRASADPVVDEIAVNSPSGTRLTCGVFLGQPREDATATIQKTFVVTHEYEDAVYFQGCARACLSACVEFNGAGLVKEIGLMPSGP